MIGLFQETIDRLLILTMFLPVLAGQSGNTGSQALAVTLRGVFLGELDLVQGEGRWSLKEALLGLLNGALVGLVAAICMYVVAAVKHMPNALMLSVVVFLAMIGSCVISGALGAVMPLVLQKARRRSGDRLEHFPHHRHQRGEHGDAAWAGDASGESGDRGFRSVRGACRSPGRGTARCRR